MQINRLNFASLRPQDLEVDCLDAVNLDDPEQYLTPFVQTRLGIWVYRFREPRWKLYAIEMNGGELFDTNEAERSGVVSYYGLDLSPEQLCTLGEGFLHFETDFGAHPASRFLFSYFDGLLYSTIHDAEGQFLNLSVSDVASDRRDRSLDETVNSLEDILIAKDSLDGVAALGLFLIGDKPRNVVAQTGVFRPALHHSPGA
jgi:hypothetical protein